MTIDEYIKKLEEQKKIAEGQFDNISVLERQVIDSLFEWMATNLPTKGGQIQITDDMTRQMSEFVLASLGVVNSNLEYQNLVSDYLVNITTIGKNIKQFQSTSNKIDFTKAGVVPVQNALIGDIITQFTQNGLNAGFAQPLRDIMYRNIVAGMSLKEAKKYLSDFILSGKDTTGKLSKYLTQTAQQGVDSYTGGINTKLAQTFKYTGYAISGSLIETSSEQCVYAVDNADSTGYLPNSEWEKILKIAKENKKAPLIDGTDMSNLPINKLHWGCRHEFTPIIKEEPIKAGTTKKEAKKEPYKSTKEDEQNFELRGDYQQLVNNVMLSSGGKLGGMTMHEAAAVNGYTSIDYRDMNRKLRGLNIPGLYDPDYKISLDAQINLMKSGLNKLPDFEGVVYRGAGLSEAEENVYRDAIGTGELIEHPAFTSTSKLSDKALNRNTRYIIQSKKGKNVMKFSEFESENEIILNAGTKFRVTEFNRNPTDGKTYIYMEEVVE
jgi:hypothetical protein